MLEEVSQQLTPEAIRSILTGLRWMFYLMTLLAVGCVCFHFAPYRIGHKPRLLLFPLLFAVALLAIFLYQSTWQLAGFTRPRFVRFMERYNPRPDNAAKHLIRGSLLDCNGNELAFTEKDGSGQRIYPYEAATAHVVGFRHPSEGLTGMEGAADYLLSGYHELRSAKDFREASTRFLQTERSIGTNLTLTIDTRLQLCAHTGFAGRRGAAVAIEPKTGAIRLLYSAPGFDPNQFDRRLNIRKDSPLLNRALHGRYPAGSTFKTAIAALLVECGIPQQINCPGEGYYAPGARRPIRDHEYYSFERRGLRWPGFGVIGLDKALAKSSNVYFAHAGVSCGVNAFNRLSESLRFNERLTLFSDGFGKISSQKGNLPTLGRGERRELSQLSIGQGRLLVTPLHMAMLAAGIANGGAIMRPRLTEDTLPEEYTRFARTATARRVARAMRHVVRTGTARAADLPGLNVCGKTGTAQNPGGDDHAWFICFAPEEDPQIAIAVLVENAGFGSASALPIATGLLRTYFADHPVSSR